MKKKVIIKQNPNRKAPEKLKIGNCKVFFPSRKKLVTVNSIKNDEIFKTKCKRTMKTKRSPRT